MEVFVDESMVEREAIPGETVEDAVRHVQSSVCPPDRLVVRFRCDGQDVPSDEMANTLQRPASELSRLEIFTGTKGALVLDAMTQASASLNETEAFCQRAAQMLTEGKTTEGMQTLGEVLRVWQQIHLAVVNSIEMLRLDLENTLVQDEPLSSAIIKPKEVLIQMRDALRAQDHVMLADVLQYELGDVTTQWYAIIDRLREEAEQRDDGVEASTIE